MDLIQKYYMVMMEVRIAPKAISLAANLTFNIKNLKTIISMKSDILKIHIVLMIIGIYFSL